MTDLRRTSVEYVVVRFDSSCETASVSQYSSLDQTVDLRGEIIHWMRDALIHADDCNQGVVITAKDLPQLQTSALLDEYVKRGAKFLCLPETEEDRSFVVWLNDYLAQGDSNACIHIAGPVGPLVLIDESNATDGVRFISDSYRPPTNTLERNSNGTHVD